jgi:hypothetical protein
MSHTPIFTHAHALAGTDGQLYNLDVGPSSAPRMSKRVWSTMSTVGAGPDARLHHCAAAVGSVFYIYGGVTDGQYACMRLCMYVCMAYSFPRAADLKHSGAHADMPSQALPVDTNTDTYNIMQNRYFPFRSETCGQLTSVHPLRYGHAFRDQSTLTLLCIQVWRRQALRCGCSAAQVIIHVCTTLWLFGGTGDNTCVHYAVVVRRHR